MLLAVVVAGLLIILRRSSCWRRLSRPIGAFPAAFISGFDAETEAMSVEVEVISVVVILAVVLRR